MLVLLCLQQVFQMNSKVFCGQRLLALSHIEWPDGILDYGFESVDTIKSTCILLEKAMYGTVQAT